MLFKRVKWLAALKIWAVFFEKSIERESLKWFCKIFREILQVLCLYLINLISPLVLKGLVLENFHVISFKLPQILFFFFPEKSLLWPSLLPFSFFLFHFLCWLYSHKCCRLTNNGLYFQTIQVNVLVVLAGMHRKFMCVTTKNLKTSLPFNGCYCGDRHRK